MKTEIINNFEKNPNFNNVLIVEKYDSVTHYLAVTLNESHDGGKLTKGDNSGIYTYYIRQSVNDTTTQYTSQPERFVTEESLKKAKKVLDKNFTTIKKIHALGKTFIHYEKMVEIVKKTVEHYKEDFYWTDIYLIGLMIQSNKPIDFYWIVRDAGTGICKLNDTVYTYYKNQRAKFYHVTDKTIREDN